RALEAGGRGRGLRDDGHGVPEVEEPGVLDSGDAALSGDFSRFGPAPERTRPGAAERAPGRSGHLTLAVALFGVMPFRCTPSSIIAESASNGTAPFRKRPFTNIAGVPETPAAWPSAISVRIFCAYLLLSRQLLN